MNYFLSICIPTYNGGENLKYNVNKLIKMQPEYGFEICVSDNASDDGTQEFMNAAANEYEFIKYHRNKENMGFAYNFDYVLNMASGEYRWLLGDDDEIVEENLGKVIQKLREHKPDICVVNGGVRKDKVTKRVKNIKSNLYTNKNNLVIDIGEQMSWISSLIFYKKLIRKIKMRRQVNNAFPHLIECLKYINNCSCNVYWIDEIIVIPQVVQQVRYNSKILDYFIKDWWHVFAFENNYSLKAKNKFLEAIVKRVFSSKDILVLRALDVINKETVKKVKNELKYYPVIFQIKIQIIKFIPLPFLKYLYYAYKKIKDKERGLYFNL